MSSKYPDAAGRRRSLLLAALIVTCRPAMAQRSDPLRAAIDSPQRSPANRSRDAARHPYETLAFFGLKPDQTVIEIAPGRGWYTEILAPLLRERGHLYVAQYRRDDPDEEYRNLRAAFDDKLAKAPEVFDRVVVGSLPTGPRFDDIAPPGGADAVLTFRNVHNWIEQGRLDAMLQAFHSVLRPGGVLGVEEHRATPGTSLARIKKSGYVTEALLIEHASRMGFALDARSEVNANPRDTKDYADGVWALPPTLKGGEADRARFVAIGESDRFTHRYVKVAG